MYRVVVVGGGWAGCAAAVESRKLGAEVTLLERTDMLLGTGLVGGIMRNNGRYTAAEEMIAMGGGDLFAMVEKNLTHKGISFPGHEHADLYSVAALPPFVARSMEAMGIHIFHQSRVVSLRWDTDQGAMQSRKPGELGTGQKLDGAKGRRIAGVEAEDGRFFQGDVFIDATGTAGPMNNCVKYGNGCAMCILRCPCFGGRVSLTGLAGVKELRGEKADGSVGSMSGSCKLLKESLADHIVERLNRDGVAVIPVPEELREDHLDAKCCQQYALPQYRDNLVLLDTGHAKLMTPFYDLARLRRIPGLENARYEDPYGGGRGNSMRYFAMAPRDNSLHVDGVENLYCAGEKAGLLVGHTEAIVTGVLAGYNSVRYAMGKEPLILPDTTAIGDAIGFVKEAMETEEGRTKKYTFSGSVYFERMKKKGLYTTDVAEIAARIENAGLSGVFGTIF